MKASPGSPEKPLRIAQLGAGRMGRTHLGALDGLEELSLVSIAEPSPEAVAACGSVLRGVEVHADAADALDAPEVSACLVVTPTDTHFDVVSEALARGLHVFCEKPLTLDAEASRVLGRQATDAGLVLQVGFWRRFCPPIERLREVVSDGRLGTTLEVRCVQWDVACPPAEWCDPNRSGGVFVDMGVHEFDQIEWLTGQRIEAVRARPLPLAKPSLARVGDYDNALVLVDLSGGATGIFDLSRNGRYADDVRIELLGSDGAAFVDTHPVARLRVGTTAGLDTAWRSDEDALLAGIRGELRAFAAAVATGDVSEVPGADDSIRATSLGQAARKSADSGERVEIPPVEQCRS